MSMQPFTPQGPTILVTANTTAPSGVQCLASGTLPSVSYRVANPEANETVWYSMVTPINPNTGQPDANAANNAKALAVIPTGGNTSAKLAIPLPAGGVEVVRGPQGAYFSGVTRTAAANLYVTPGDGM